MSGIYGLWNSDGQTIMQSTLDSMASAVAHRGPDGDFRWVENFVGIGCQLLRATNESFADSQPGTDELGNRIVLDGRIDNLDEVRRKLRLDPNTRETEVILATFRRYGDTFANQLNGEFALALLDARGQRLLIARDPVGTRPLYYHQNARRVVFGSEIKAILPALDAPPKANLPYLAVQLLGGVPPYEAGMTFFEGISGLHPGHTLICERDRSPRSLQHWDFDVEHPVRFKRESDYVDAFREIFIHAVRKRIRTRMPVAFGLSGGLDSSSAFCVAQQLIRNEPGLAPAIIGINHEGEEGSSADEREYIAAIERDYGVKVERLPIFFIGLEKGISRTTRAFEAPIADGTWRNNELMFERVRTHGGRVLIGGHFGDQVMFNSSYLSDLLCGLRIPTLIRHLRTLPKYLGEDSSALLRFVLRDTAKWSFPEFARPLLMAYRKQTAPMFRDQAWYTRRFRDEARRSWPVYRPKKKKFVSRSANLRYIEARAQFYIQTMEFYDKQAASHGTEHLSPYLDRDVLQFLMQIPGEMIGVDGVPRAIIRRAMEGILPVEIARRHTKGDFTSIQNEMVSRHYQEIVKWFSGKNLVVEEGFVSQEGLESTLAEIPKHMTEYEGCRMTWDLTDLMAFEEWMRQFIRPETRSATMGEA
jgi:asparagine synthase (glutamine-hydrolysing)